MRCPRAVALAAIAVAVSSCQSTHRVTPQVVRVAVVVTQTTGTLSQHLARLPDLYFTRGRLGARPAIRIDDRIRYQAITGVGAAMTDTAAWLLYATLPPAVRTRVMRSLFGTDGLRLGALRVPIGASDFTKDGRPYSYDDLPPGQSDPSLSRFSVAHDDGYIVPALRAALALNPHLELLAAPWSAPPWMKANDAFSNILSRGRLLDGDYPVLARYFVRFIEAYRSRGIMIDDVSPQNEPGQGTYYPGMAVPPSAEARFIVHYLVPALRAAHLPVRVYAHDFKWLFLPRVLGLLSASGVRSAIAGVAWHCYDGSPAVMDVVHRLDPNLDQIESECSGGIAPGPTAELEIAAFRHWASTVVLWNLALDPRGGPVEPPNLGCRHCVGVLTVDERDHSVSYGADYYQLGQFSRFVARGAHRVASNTFVSYNSPTRRHKVNWATANVDDVAFVNPDGSRVLLVHNNASAAKAFAVTWHGRWFTYTLPADATVTFAWR